MQWESSARLEDVAGLLSCTHGIVSILHAQVLCGADAAIPRYGDLEDEGRVLIERVIVNMIPMEDIHRLLVQLQREYTFDEQWLLRNILVPEVVLRLTLEDNPLMRKDLYLAWVYVRRTSQYGQGRELSTDQREVLEDLTMYENLQHSRKEQKTWSFAEQRKYYAPLVI